MVLLLEQFVVMCPKPRHVKHFVLEVLVEDSGVQVEGVSLEVLSCGVDSLKKLEGVVFFGNVFLSFQDDL